MRGYRLFFMTKDGHIASAEEFEAMDDTAAIAHAAKARHPHAIELWERARLVKRLDAGQK